MQTLGLPGVGLKLLEGTTFPILPWAVLPEDLEEIEKEQRLLLIIRIEVIISYIYVCVFL